MKNWEKKQRQEQKKAMRELDAEVGAYIFKQGISSLYGKINSPSRNHKKEGKEG